MDDSRPSLTGDAPAADSPDASGPAAAPCGVAAVAAAEAALLGAVPTPTAEARNLGVLTGFFLDPTAANMTLA